MRAGGDGSEAMRSFKKKSTHNNQLTITILKSTIEIIPSKCLNKTSIKGVFFHGPFDIVESLNFFFETLLNPVLTFFLTIPNNLKGTI